MRKLFIVIGLMLVTLSAYCVGWSQDYYQIDCPTPSTIIVDGKSWQGDFIISKQNTYVAAITAYTNNDVAGLVPKELIKNTSYSYPDPSLDYTCYYSTNKANVIATISSDGYLPSTFANCNFNNVTSAYMQCIISKDHQCTLSCQNQS